MEIKKFRDFINEEQEHVLFEDFNEDSDGWFDIISLDNKAWKKTGGLEITKKRPTKKTLEDLISFVEENNSLPGAKELLKFLNDAKANKYKKEFGKFQGEHSVISEILSLFKQAVEY